MSSLYETTLADGRILYSHFANNRGRGSDNCTLTLCQPGTARPMYTRNFRDCDIVAQTRTSAWKGNRNLSTRVLGAIGLTKADID